MSSCLGPHRVLLVEIKEGGALRNRRVFENQDLDYLPSADLLAMSLWHLVKGCLGRVLLGRWSPSEQQAPHW